MIELLLQADRLLTVGLTDQADAVYRRVAAQDPRNAIAVVGMARCALARADDHEAYRLASRALTIDPENEMARRMEARMREVLETRGEVPGEGATTAEGVTTGVADRADPVAVVPMASAVPTASVVPTVSAVPPSSAPAAATAVAPPSAAPAASTVATATAAPAATSPAPARRSFLDRIRGRGR